jgi:hypothetical protein
LPFHKLEVIENSKKWSSLQVLPNFNMKSEKLENNAITRIEDETKTLSISTSSALNEQQKLKLRIVPNSFRESAAHILEDIKKSQQFLSSNNDSTSLLNVNSSLSYYEQEQFNNRSNSNQDIYFHSDLETSRIVKKLKQKFDQNQQNQFQIQKVN